MDMAPCQSWAQGGSRGLERLADQGPEATPVGAADGRDPARGPPPSELASLTRMSSQQALLQQGGVRDPGPVLLWYLCPPVASESHFLAFSLSLQSPAT